MKTISCQYLFLVFVGFLFLNACTSTEKTPTAAPLHFVWENANIYFLLTDRFSNGDPTNDVNFNRTRETAKLRGFEGGDIQGVIQKIEQGYFDQLGITALWLTPWFEQIHGGTDEGTGFTYAFHGYWPRDWTSLDPNFGTEEELASLVETAHAHGIRVVMDVIINHTGPVTEVDPVWPPEWVRTAPPCTYTSYETTVTCTLVENLPDIRSESTTPVELPPRLLEKWEEEGRLESELEELDAFFERTGYPRAPRYYIIKWLTDFVRQYGIDGYRLDTAKHIEEEIWKELAMEARAAFEAWKNQHPEKVLDAQDFFMVGEVYGYGISNGKDYFFGDREVDYYAHGIKSLINFDFKTNASKPYEELFSSYSEMLNGELKGHGVLNYISSHDDGGPFDRERKNPIEAATKLLLCPGASQIYYGDESSRELIIPGTQGDATLRSKMNWKEIESGAIRQGHAITDVMKHYQKLGLFRRDHPSVGAGKHHMISKQPYLFSRSYVEDDYMDQVVVGLELKPGEKNIPVKNVFQDGTELYDYYSGSYVTVDKGSVSFHSEYKLVLLGRKKT